MTIRTTTLGNGLRVVTERMADVRSVALGFWVGVGGRDEPAAQAGASHFLEHLLFKGTPTRSALEVSRAIERVGGEMNAFTAREYTTYYARVLDDAFPAAFEVLSDVMRNPAFRPDEVESERQVILEELLMRDDDPADLVHERFHEALFPGHELGRDVLGDEATIEALGADAVAEFFASHYRPAGMVVAAAGSVDHDHLVELVAADFGEATGGEPPERRRPELEPLPLLVDDRDTEQSHVAVGVRGLPRDDPDRYALAVLEAAMGGGSSSRLFQEVREQRGLAYSVFSFRSAYCDTGTLGASAGTAPANVREVLEVVGGVLDELARDGLTPVELETAVGGMVGGLALGLEDSGARMSRIGRSLLVHGRVEPLDEVVAAIRAVGLDDVGAVATRLLGGERTVAVVGPGADLSLAGAA